MELIVIVMIVLALVALAAFTGVVLLDTEPDGPRAGAPPKASPPRACDCCEGRTDACAPEEGWPTARYMMPEHNGVDAYPVETWLCMPCAYLTAEALSEYAAGVAALERSDEPEPAGTDR